MRRCSSAQHNMYATACATLPLDQYGVTVTFTGGTIDMDNEIDSDAERVFLRPCYERIINALIRTSHIGPQMQPPTGKHRKAFVLGTPGTGKTVCRNVACAALVQQCISHHASAHIIFQKASGASRLETPVVHVSAGGEVSGSLVGASEEILGPMVAKWQRQGDLVVSLIDVSEGRYRRNVTKTKVEWYFSHPDESLIKNKDRLKSHHNNDMWMPLWTLKELQTAREGLFPFQAGDSVVDPVPAHTDEREEGVGEVELRGTGVQMSVADEDTSERESGCCGEVDWEAGSKAAGYSSPSQLHRLRGSYALVMDGDYVKSSYAEPVGITASELVAHRFGHFGGNARACLEGPESTLEFLHDDIYSGVDLSRIITHSAHKPPKMVACRYCHSFFHFNPKRGLSAPSYCWATPFIRSQVCLAAMLVDDSGSESESESDDVVVSGGKEKRHCCNTAGVSTPSSKRHY
ncbi:hypothetical protein KIPB_001087 [Kipferlia bialata]|uniref:Uncharacterized protein n=1 Tax=Kipferlia bialata TaxID=797122 RepID=A0A9K3GF94_9EUKA|nr:hypothetical protein KIPB_001087 [Kipferlia bialata]|eukprot:g1087.t1